MMRFTYRSQGLLSSLIASLFSSVFIATISVSLFAGHAFAQQEESSAEPEIIANNADSSVPVCTPDFARDLQALLFELKTAAPYLDANELPPNLRQSVKACAAIEEKHGDITCRINQAQTASTKELLTICTGLKSIQAEKNSGANESTGDGRALSELTPSGLTLKVANTTEAASVIQDGVNQAKSVFFIDGRALSLIESSVTVAPVRCTFFKAPNKQIEILPDLATKAFFINETFVSGSHVTRVILEGRNLAIDCATQTGSAITFGEFKTVFGSLLEITYEEQSL